MLNAVQPREQSGRDSFGRFRVQARSAAIATLSILGNNEVDRVYCDLHDDFVVRINKSGRFCYVFYQVKTKKKQNHNWSVNEIFGINPKTKDPKKIDNEQLMESFAGKLLIHTVNFGDNCEAVIFQTNINVADPIIDLMKDIQDQKFDSKVVKLLIDRFSDCFATGKKIDAKEVKKKLLKLQFETDVAHLKLENNNFGPIAKEKIFEYSEIDLTHDEFQGILTKLVELVSEKSSGVLEELSIGNIEKHAAISITELLEVLSISWDAYNRLLEGGDPLAVKNASIIQRTLQKAGANDEQVNYCARCKILWDQWYLDNRHIIDEFQLRTIQSNLIDILRSTVQDGAMDLRKLEAPINEYFGSVSPMGYGLDRNTILGGVLAELVRERR